MGLVDSLTVQLYIAKEEGHTSDFDREDAGKPTELYHGLTGELSKTIR